MPCSKQCNIAGNGLGIPPPVEAQQLASPAKRCSAAFDDVALDFGQVVPHGRTRPEVDQQSVLDDLVHPLPHLAATDAIEPAIAAQQCGMFEHDLPKAGNALSG